MIHGKILGGATLVAALWGGTAALANVTAQEVWDSWTAYYANLGQKLEAASAGMQGDTLVITEAKVESTTPEGSFSLSVPEIRMRETGDGRVEVTMAPEIAGMMKSNPSTGEKVDMPMTVTQSGLSMIVSGAADDMTYDVSAATVGAKIDGMTVDGAAVPLKVDVTAEGNTGTYQVSKSGGNSIVSNFATETVRFDVDAQDPEGKGSAQVSGTLSALKGDSTVAMPANVNMADLNAALGAGAKLEGSFGYGAGDYTMHFTDETGTVDGTFKGDGGALVFAMSQDGVRYGAQGKAGQLSLSGSVVPFPVDISLAESAFDLAFPVVKSDEAKPFSALLKLVDLSVSDGIWGMIDPTAQLPHDPATLIVDLSGSLKMLVDIFDPAAAEALGEAPPAEVQTVTLNQLKLTAVGADVAGTGQIDVNNAGPVPQPVGYVDLQLAGINALMDKLVAMGLLPQDQAMGARMMLSLFAVPTGEDTMTSKIEFKEDGGIYANGQRLQ